MNLNRRLERLIKFTLDECIPPVLRDNRMLMSILLKIAFGKKYSYFIDFKDRYQELTESEFEKIYQKTSPVFIHENGTDLSKAIIEEIKLGMMGTKVADIGCGNGILAGLLANSYKVTGFDILIDATIIKRFPDVAFVKANLSSLPVNDKEFDTTICAHTLEHVNDLFDAIKELRRVTRSKLIIVVPKERPYKYTFNLHVHFFPYKHILLNYLLYDKPDSLNFEIKEIDGCWYYQEYCSY
ncbi:MAG: class I SAM-dependent methyltransferase [SAR324 cluster bacterium]|nr:class I SAM-dependent methyltransferase [SAR324 cluster bacterium]